jgi:flavin-dependent dehydrogenase
MHAALLREATSIPLSNPDAAHINFPTNHGLTCVAIQAPIAGFHAFRADIEGNFFRTLDRVPELAERVRAAKRAERWCGTADLTNVFRKPYGPGWALIGGAGYHKDPILAQGLSDTFRDADVLAEAIDAGFSGRAPLDDALAVYEQRRNEAAMPGYAANRAMAAFLPLPPEILAQRTALRGSATTSRSAYSLTDESRHVTPQDRSPDWSGCSVPLPATLRDPEPSNSSAESRGRFRPALAPGRCE